MVWEEVTYSSNATLIEHLLLDRHFFDLPICWCFPDLVLHSTLTWHSVQCFIIQSLQYADYSGRFCSLAKPETRLSSIETTVSGSRPIAYFNADWLIEVVRIRQRWTIRQQPNNFATSLLRYKAYFWNIFLYNELLSVCRLLDLDVRIVLKYGAVCRNIHGRHTIEFALNPSVRHPAWCGFMQSYTQPWYTSQQVWTYYGLLPNLQHLGLSFAVTFAHS